MLPYAELIDQAVAASFQGWDFDWLRDRATSTPLPWSYDELARTELQHATRLLDLDTGGGEALAAFAPLPEATIATEGYEPNLPIARARLAPLGVDVRRHDGTDSLPVEDDAVDLILNRHGRLVATEVARVLRPGGILLTQQVGSQNDIGINEALGAPPVTAPTGTTDATDATSTEAVVRSLVAQGFDIVEVAEHWPDFAFADIGALVYHLKAIPWQIPDFDVTTYEPALRKLDEQIRATGPFVVRNHRYLIRARRHAR
jgi:SAM-dependent methyltransferase